jgi:hypothetical protein
MFHDWLLPGNNGFNYPTGIATCTNIPNICESELPLSSVVEYSMYEYILKKIAKMLWWGRFRGVGWKWLFSLP